MYKNIISKPIALFALITGIWTSYIVNVYFRSNYGWSIAAALLTAMVFYITAILFVKMTRKGFRKINRWLDNTSLDIVLGGTAGLLIGGLVGLICTYPLSMLRGLGSYLILIVFLLCGYLGIRIGSHRARDVWKLFPAVSAPPLNSEPSDNSNCKVLDTSAIIDGRIYDVCLSRFLEGTLLVPVFVIEELQHIADSSDNLRRNKGRRGLELLSKMNKHSEIKIDIIEASIPEEKEVDMKLIRLCKQINASIITNDYNLNKVAELQGIPVLNINELTNAVKVVVYPGETMQISVLKEGKEPGQGVGYLEDGTMVVVEDAQNELGNNLEVVVTSVFQTAAGRMIFTRKTREESSSVITNGLQTVKMQEVNLYG